VHRCSLSAFLAASLVAGSAAAQHVVISEILYQPPGGSAFADAEFVEILNAGTSAANLGNAAFTAGIAFTFPAGFSLAPGARAVVVRNRALFASRYGAVPGLVAGNFSGALNNSGETLTLSSATGAVLAEVRYGTDGAWPTRPAGQGGSLELVDPAGPQNLSANWRASSEFYGSPGTAGAGPQDRIVVNELLAHTDPPLEDAVELFNRADVAIDVGGWFLSNSRGDPTRFRIPDRTVVPPRGFRVIYEYQFFPVIPAPGQTPFTFSAARGDDVVLLSANAAGNPLRWEDVQQFPASPNGHTFGRFPDGEGPFLLMAQMTLGTSVVNTDPPELLPVFRQGLGAPNAPHAVGPVVFNRIRYSAPADGVEFVELLNITDAEAPLFDPRFPTNTFGIEGGITFRFPEPETLPPGGRIVVAGTANFAAVRALLSLPATVPIVGPYSGQLASDGEQLRLVRPDDPQQAPRPDAGFVPYYVAEQIDYSAAAPWPVLAQPDQQLIRRRVGAGPGYDPANWEAASVQATVPLARLQVTRYTDGVLGLRVTGNAGSRYFVESVAISGNGRPALIAVAASGTLNVSTNGPVTLALSLPVSGDGGLYRLRIE